MAKIDFSISKIFEIPDLQEFSYINYLGFNVNSNSFQLLFLNKDSSVKKVVDINSVKNWIWNTEYESEIQKNDDQELLDPISQEYLPYYISFSDKNQHISFVFQDKNGKNNYTNLATSNLLCRSETTKEILNWIPAHPFYNFRIFDPKKRFFYCIEGTNIYWNLISSGIIYIYHVLEHLQFKCLTLDDIENMLNNTLTFYFLESLKFQVNNSDNIDYDHEIKDVWIEFLKMFTKLKLIAMKNPNQINIIYDF